MAGYCQLPTVLAAEEAFEHMRRNSTDSAVTWSIERWKSPTTHMFLSAGAQSFEIFVSLPRCPVLVSCSRLPSTQALQQHVTLCLVGDSAGSIEVHHFPVESQQLEELSACVMGCERRPRAQYPRVALDDDLGTTTFVDTNLVTRILVRVGNLVLRVPLDTEFMVVGRTDSGVLIGVLPVPQICKALDKDRNWALVFEVDREQLVYPTLLPGRRIGLAGWSWTPLEHVLRSGEAYLEAVDHQPRGDVFDDAERECILTERLASAAYNDAVTLIQEKGIKGAEKLPGITYRRAITEGRAFEWTADVDAFAERNNRTLNLARLRWAFAAMTRTVPLVETPSIFERVIAKKNLARLRWFSAANDLVMEQEHQERHLLFKTLPRVRFEVRLQRRKQMRQVKRAAERIAHRSLRNVLSAWRLRRPWEQRKWRRLLRLILIKSRQSAVHWRDISKELSRSFRQAVSRSRDFKEELSHRLSQQEQMIQCLESLVAKQEAELREMQTNLDGTRKSLQHARSEEINRECYVCLEVSGFANRPWHQFTGCEHYSVCEHCMLANLVRRCLVCEPNMS